MTIRDFARRHGLRAALFGSAAFVALAVATAPFAVGIDEGKIAIKPAAAYASSCFIAGTKVLMADGSERAIEAVKAGDRVRGADGMVNAVVGIEKVFLAGRKLYGFNGGTPFVTEEHPFMTKAGWKSINPRATSAENQALIVLALKIGDSVAVAQFSGPQVAGSNALAIAPVLHVGWERLTRIEAIDADPSTAVFNLLLDGNHSYFADGYLVHNKGGGGDGGGDGGGSGSGSGGSGSGSGGSGSGSGSGGGSGSSGSGSGSSGDDGSSSNSGPGSANSGSNDSNSGASGSNSTGGTASTGGGQGRGGQDDPPDHDINDDHGGHGNDDGPNHQ